MSLLLPSSPSTETMTTTDDDSILFDCDLPNPFPSLTPTPLSHPLPIHHHHPPMTKHTKLLTLVLQIMVMFILISAFLLFMGIAFLILIHLCIVGGGFRQAFPATTPDRDTDDFTPGLSQSDLQKLPSFDYGFDGVSDCAVCLDGFQKGHRCRLLPLCKHVFHAHCVDVWLSKIPACPICRTVVDLQGSNVEGVVEFGQSGEVGSDQLEGSSHEACI